MMLNPMERWSLHLSALFVGLSGLLLGWFKYFGQRIGEFGPEPHPAQSWIQHIHVLTGPLLVFTLGILVKAHVLPVLRAKGTQHRSSGLLIVGVLAPMILAGYGLQICVDPRWRTAIAWIHGPFSLVFLASYVVHLSGAGRRRLQLWKFIRRQSISSQLL